MFLYEKCLHEAQHCANHNQNMFILSAIKTTSQGSFDLSQAKHVNANVVHLLNTAMPFIPEGLDE